LPYFVLDLGKVTMLLDGKDGTRQLERFSIRTELALHKTGSFTPEYGGIRE
jgi:hypothetical protein